MSKPAITLGVQSGDIESSESTRPAFLALRKALAANCPGPYSKNIEEFAIVLRISGDIWKFEGEGPQKLRINRAKRYITIDVVVPQQKWKGVGLTNVAKYLSKAVKDAIEAMASKLIASKIEVDSSLLFTDLESALSQFEREAMHF